MGLYDAPSFNKFKVGTFKGIDVSVPEDQQQPYRAADALNMIPDAAGEVRKRPGVQYEKKISGIAGSIMEIYDGRFIVACLKTGNELTYKVYIFNMGSWEPAICTHERPRVIAYGDKHFIFLHIIDFKNEIYTKKDFEAGFMIVGDDECVVYGSDACKYVYDFIRGVFDERNIMPDDPYLTLPIVTIGSLPGGGGTPNQQINLLNPWVTESFCVTNPEGENTFYLQIPVFGDDMQWNMRQNGDSMKEGGKFSVQILSEINFKEETGEDIKVLRWVNRPIHSKDGYRPAANRIFLSKEGNELCEYRDDHTGLTKKINVNLQPDTAWGNIGPTPKPGEDNVRISHFRNGWWEGFVDLCKCVCGTTFGVGGYKDRLFLGGPDNKVYYSEMENPFYFGELNYVKTAEESKVMALDGTAGALSIITDKGIAFLSGKASAAIEDGYAADATFVISNMIPAPAPMEYGNTAILGGEIVYLSNEGIIAITSKENYAERYAEHRSSLVDKKMMSDEPYFIFNFGRYLLIFCKTGHCWLLDENQPNRDGDKPYSSHQYEGYRMDRFFATAVYVEDDKLYLIENSTVFRWMDGSLPSHYHDNGNKPIRAYWETPWLYGTSFYKNKTFMRLGVLLGELRDIITGSTVETNTGVLVEGKKNDEDWKVLMDEEIVSRTFSFDRLNFEYLTFRGVAQMPHMLRKIKLKKAKRLKLRFSNETIDQPFILQEFGLDYVQED